MDNTIALLFQILMGFVFINMAISIILYLTSRQKEYLRLVFYWAMVNFVFVVQYVFQVHPLKIALAFTVSVIPIFYITWMLLSTFGRKPSIKLYISLIFAGLTTTLLLYKLNAPFKFYALPLSMAVASPLFEGIYWIIFKRRKHSTMIQKFLAGVMVVGTIHCINFALYRMDDGAQIWGWMISFVLYQMFSILLPAFVVERMGKIEKQKLAKANEKLLMEIKERKRIEEELEWIFNLSLDMVGSGNLDGYFTKINPAFERILGYKEEEFLKKPFIEFVYDEDVKKTKEALAEAVKGKRIIHIINRYKCKGGSLKWIEWSAQAISQKNLFITVGRDITGRKHVEDQLIVYQRKLKSLSSSLLLSEERERRHISEDLHDRIGQALTVIKMKMEELRDPQVDTERECVLNETSKLLDNAIQDTRTLTFEISPPILYALGFEPAVEWLIEQFRERHNVPIEYKVKGDGRMLEDDVSFFLFKSVRELLFNAIKYARAERIKVLVQRDKNRILISVEDDGVGFDFSKVQFSLEDLTGFGLFSIRERMENFGGNLDVKSKPGQGTRIALEMLLKR